jgi:hypothetical protein
MLGQPYTAEAMLPYKCVRYIVIAPCLYEWKFQQIYMEIHVWQEVLEKTYDTCFSSNAAAGMVRQEL